MWVGPMRRALGWGPVPCPSDLGARGEAGSAQACPALQPESGESGRSWGHTGWGLGTPVGLPQTLPNRGQLLLPCPLLLVLLLVGAGGQVA